MKTELSCTFFIPVHFELSSSPELSSIAPEEKREYFSARRTFSPSDALKSYLQCNLQTPVNDCSLMILPSTFLQSPNQL